MNFKYNKFAILIWIVYIWINKQIDAVMESNILAFFQIEF